MDDDQILDPPCETKVKIPKSLLDYINSSPDLIFVLSLRGLFLHASYLPLLEYNVDEIIGSKLSDFVHPSDLVSIQRDLRDCSNTGSVNFICRFKRKMSGFIYLESNARVYTGSKRNKCFIVAGRPVNIPKLLPSDFFKVDCGECWIKVSEYGLFLYTFHASGIFGIEDSLLFAHSLYDFLALDFHHSVNIVLTDSEKDKSASIPVIIKSKEYVLRILKGGNTAWIQIKQAGRFEFGSGPDLMAVIDSARSSSLFYECNKLKLKNSKLEKESYTIG